MQDWRDRDASAATTGSDAAVFKLKRDILRGKLAPDEKLRVRELAGRYGIGASPMREALARLSGAGLVRLQGQKGFRVSPLGRADLIDITATRRIVEAEALALAIRSATDDWEAELVKSYHLLGRELGRRGDGSPEWLDAFEARHHAFHRSLISACPLRSLREFCDELYLRSERYRRVLFGYSFDGRDLAAEHENLMAAALSRDVRKARQALVLHIGLTADLLKTLMPGEVEAA
ncbi:MAG: GntR family transcriptional regulator [Hyphomicrobiales bacterium]